MTRIIKERETVVEISYYRAFLDKQGNGFSFPCTETGELLDTNPEIARMNFAKCKRGDFPDLEDQGIVKSERRYTNPAILECDCKNHVPLVNKYLGACSCSECGRWYNLFGQQLINPEYWED